MAPSVVASSMTVQIGQGSCVVPDSSTPPNGAWLCSCNAPENVAIATAPASGQSRVDLVVAQVNDAAASWQFVAVTGTPAASGAVAPPVPAASLVICQIVVTGGSATLSATNMADLRTGPFPWTSLSLSSGWTNVAGYQWPQYCRDQAGFVNLRGAVANGAAQSTGVVFASLPFGFRPALAEIFTGFGAATPTTAWQINVATNGQLSMNWGSPSTAVSAAVTYLSLSGIRFTTQ